MKRRTVITAAACAILAFSATDNLFARGGGGMGGGMGGGSGAGSGSMNGYGSKNGAFRSADADGDGVANRTDADYVRPQDGTGSGATDFKGAGTGTRVLDGTGPHGKNVPAQ
ncbi:MAG: hypothetical protein HGB02_00930 [Chlorobiaceae bacterium]|nr:hypothetical protein [Chlorobiaceae bacterium]